MEEGIEALDHQIYGSYTLSMHIGDTLETLSHEKPVDPLGAFEEVSTLLWEQRHIQTQPSQPSVPPQELDRCNSLLSLLEKTGSSAARKLDSMFFEFRDKWTEVGIVLDNDTALLLYCSLIQLAETEIISAVRFWGIFRTPVGPLYVAEADIGLEFREADAPVVGPYEVPVEVGIGVNRFVYYVTRSPFDSWVRLPDARPSDISKTRKAVWNLTGDLAAGAPAELTEDAYLRALIARISSSTIIAPTDYIVQWQPEEEEEQKEPVDEEEEQKEAAPKQLRLVVNKDYETVEDVASIEWVHVRPFMLPQGRETYKKAAKPPKAPKPVREKKARGSGEEEEEVPEEEQAPEEAAPAEEEEEVPEEGPELFGPVTEDEPIREEEPCWANRTVTSPIQGQSFQLAESVRWPGSYNISDGRKACSFYYGLGNKFVINGYQPPKPPPIAKEYRKKMRERKDPTIKEEKALERKKLGHKEEEEEEERKEKE
jgi:radial spoke head protein 4A